MPSVFSKIIAGEIPCYKIYEDDKTLAFLDINPETRGHTLVIPKLEVDKIYDLPDEDYEALMATVKKISQNNASFALRSSDVPHREKEKGAPELLPRRLCLYVYTF